MTPRLEQQGLWHGLDGQDFHKIFSLSSLQVCVGGTPKLLTILGQNFCPREAGRSLNYVISSSGPAACVGKKVL